jgi:hypothetical protein
LGTFITMSRKDNTKQKKAKEKKAKNRLMHNEKNAANRRAMALVDLQMSRWLSKQNTIEPPSKIDEAQAYLRSLGEACFLFPATAKQGTRFIQEKCLKELNDKMSANLKQKSYDFYLYNPPPIYLEMGEDSPWTYILEVMQTFERDELPLELFPEAITFETNEIYVEDLNAYVVEMEEDAKKCLDHLQRNFSNQSIASGSAVDETMNVSIRYIQSLLASKLGVRLNYTDDLSNPLTKEVQEYKPPNQIGQMEFLEFFSKNKICTLSTRSQAVEYLYQKSMVRFRIIHYVACAIITEGLMAQPPISKFNILLEGLSYETILNEFPVMGITGVSSENTSLEFLHELHSVYLAALKVPLLHAFNLVTIDDLLQVEPFINELRTQDAVRPLSFNVQTAIQLLNHAYAEELTEQIKIENAFHKIKKNFNYFDEPILNWSRVGHISDCFFTEFQPAYENEKGTPMPRSYLDALEAYIISRIKQLVVLDWNKEKNISESISNMIEMTNSVTQEKIHTAINTFVESINKNGLSIELFEEYSLESYQKLLWPIESDGSPIIASIQLPKWTDQLHPDSKNAFNAAEFTFESYLNFNPTVRIKTSPEDWSPVLVSFATALENEFGRKPYQYVIERISKDETKWSSEELKTLKDSTFSKLARQILNIRNGKTNKLPTLGDICFYIENGLDSINKKNKLGTRRQSQANLFDAFILTLIDSNYRHLVTKGFLNSLITFKDYRNEVAHPPPVDRIKATVGRRIAMSMLEHINKNGSF